MDKHNLLQSLRNHPHYTMARAIERKRGGTVLYIDDGSNYFPEVINRFRAWVVGTIGRNFTMATVY